MIGNILWGILILFLLILMGSATFLTVLLALDVWRDWKEDRKDGEG